MKYIISLIVIVGCIFLYSPLESFTNQAAVTIKYEANVDLYDDNCTRLKIKAREKYWTPRLLHEDPISIEIIECPNEPIELKVMFKNSVLRYTYTGRYALMYWLITHNKYQFNYWVKQKAWEMLKRYDQTSLDWNILMS